MLGEPFSPQMLLQALLHGAGGPRGGRLPLGPLDVVALQPFARGLSPFTLRLSHEMSLK